MDREEAIKLLNKNVQKFDESIVIKFITEYLIEKEIKEDRIGNFITLLNTNIALVLSNAMARCTEHSIKYFVNKYSINSLSKDSKTFYYF